jgi:hypothetical protein
MGYMKKILLALFLSITLSGCFTDISAPPNSVGFRDTDSIDDLAGTYQNRGEAALGKGRSPVYLSRIIWPNDKNISHGAIQFVEVSVIDHDTLVLVAHSGDKIAKKENFVVGKDFQLRSGRIYLKQKIGLPGAEVPIAGVIHESSILGVDEKGDGKYQQNSGATGLVYMLIPFSGKTSDNIRFVRINKEQEKKLRETGNACASKAPNKLSDEEFCLCLGMVFSAEKKTCTAAQ